MLIELIVYAVIGLVLLSFLLAWRKSVRLMKCEKYLLKVIPKKDPEYYSHTRALVLKVCQHFKTRRNEVVMALIRLSNRGYVTKGPRDDTWSWTG